MSYLLPAIRIHSRHKDGEEELRARHGVIAYADSLDTVGILSKEVKTARQVYGTSLHALLTSCATRHNC